MSEEKTKKNNDVEIMSKEDYYLRKIEKLEELTSAQHMIIVKQKEKIDALEELLMLRKWQKDKGL